MHYQKQLRYLLGLFLITLLFAGCSSQAGTPVSANVLPTETLNPSIGLSYLEYSQTQASISQTTTAVPPVQLAQEDIKYMRQDIQAIQTLCFEAQVGYLSAEPSGDHLVDITNTVKRILTEMGLQVVSKRGSCNATLIFDLTGKAHAGEYIRSGDASNTCYTGAEINGQITLSLAGHGPIILPISEEKPCDFGVIYRCPAEVEAPMEIVLSKAVLDSLALIWGPQVYAHALGDSQSSVRWYAADAIERIGPEHTNELFPIIIQLLEDKDKIWRYEAVYALKHIEPEAIEAVPYLIQALEDEDENVRSASAMVLGQFEPVVWDATPALIQALEDTDLNVRRSAGQSLQVITGQDFGQDFNAWQQWWEEQ